MLLVLQKHSGLGGTACLDTASLFDTGERSQAWNLAKGWEHCASVT